MQKEVTVMYFKIISQHLGGGSEENHDTLQSGEVVFQKQIRSITASATLLYPFLNFSYLFHHYYNLCCCYSLQQKTNKQPTTTTPYLYLNNSKYG
jgi:hypothetical protein